MIANATDESARVKECKTWRRPRGRYATGVLAAIMMVLAAPAARAEKAAIIVTGSASERDRTLVTSAVTEAITKASLTVDGETFAAEEIGSIVKCLDNDRPWSCIEPTARSHDLARVVVVQLALVSPKPNTPAIRVQLVLADSDRIPPEEERFCDGVCSEAKLIELIHDAMGALFVRTSGEPDPRHVTTTAVTLTVNTTPPGASIRIDGQAAGTAGNPLATTVGTHTLDVELPGYSREHRVIDLDANATVHVELRPERRSRVLPYSLIAGGAVLAGGCIAYGFTLDASPTVPGSPQSRFLVSWPAVGGAVAGAALVGAGLYLLLRSDDKPASTPTASIVPGGAVLGWARSFD